MRRITQKLANGRKLFMFVTPSPINCLKMAKKGDLLLKCLLLIPEVDEVLKIDTLEGAASKVVKSAGSIVIEKIHNKTISLIKAVKIICKKSECKDNSVKLV